MVIGNIESDYIAGHMMWAKRDAAASHPAVRETIAKELEVAPFFDCVFQSKFDFCLGLEWVDQWPVGRETGPSRSPASPPHRRPGVRAWSVSRATGTGGPPRQPAGSAAGAWRPITGHLGKAIAGRVGVEGVYLRTHQ